MRYSPSTGGFYPEDIDYPNLPNDVKVISRATYLALLAAQEQGKEIVPDQDGSPVAVDPVVSSEPPLLSKVQWKFFLYVTGFDQAANAALAAMPKTNPQQIATWAGMKAVIEDSAYYRLSKALELVGQVRAMNLPGVTLPTDEAVSAAWAQAATFSISALE